MIYVKMIINSANKQKIKQQVNRNDEKIESKSHRHKITR